MSPDLLFGITSIIVGNLSSDAAWRWEKIIRKVIHATLASGRPGGSNACLLLASVVTHMQCPASTGQSLKVLSAQFDRTV